MKLDVIFSGPNGDSEFVWTPRWEEVSLIAEASFMFEGHNTKYHQQTKNPEHLKKLEACLLLIQSNEKRPGRLEPSNSAARRVRGHAWDQDKQNEGTIVYDR